MRWLGWWLAWWFAPLEGLALTDAEREAFEANGYGTACPHCGGFHEFTCPYVAEVEYYETGALKRVVLRPEHRKLVRHIAG